MVPLNCDRPNLSSRKFCNVPAEPKLAGIVPLSSVRWSLSSSRAESCARPGGRWPASPVVLDKSMCDTSSSRLQPTPSQPQQPCSASSHCRRLLADHCGPAALQKKAASCSHSDSNGGAGAAAGAGEAEVFAAALRAEPASAKRSLRCTCARAGRWRC